MHKFISLNTLGYLTPDDPKIDIADDYMQTAVSTSAENFSSLFAQEIVILTTYSAVSAENFIKMTSFWQLIVQSVLKISSKWQDFRRGNLPIEIVNISGVYRDKYSYINCLAAAREHIMLCVCDAGKVYTS